MTCMLRWRMLCLSLLEQRHEDRINTCQTGQRCLSTFMHVSSCLTFLEILSTGSRLAQYFNAFARECLDKLKNKYKLI